MNASASSTSPDPPAARPLRVLTIDVEEYFHIEAAYSAIGPSRWHAWPSRVEASVDLLLAMFERHDRRGTFFVLGDAAKRCPGMTGKIADAGHEIASHGTNHDRLHRLTPQTFREDLLASKQLLEDQSGAAVIGYRAPTFSVVPQTAWAIDVLLEAGFEYDASIFPVRHPWYGVPDAPDRPFYVQSSADGGRLLEAPALTWSPTGLLKAAARGKKLPVAGGGYFRLLPLWFMRKGLQQAAASDRPAVLYFHPWEFDPGFPKMPLSLTGRLRTYTGLASAADRLERIMREDADWRTMAGALDVFRAQAAQREPFVLG